MANPNELSPLTPADEARFDAMMPDEANEGSQDQRIGAVGVSGQVEISSAAAESDDVRFDTMMARDGGTPTDPEVAAVRSDAELPEGQAELDALADKQRDIKNADLTRRFGPR